MVIRSKWGATRDGTLAAALVDIVSDAGAYMYTSNKVLANSVVTCTGPYRIPNVRVVAAPSTPIICPAARSAASVHLRASSRPSPRSTGWQRHSA